jgi:hypothetical protein
MRCVQPGLLNVLTLTELCESVQADIFLTRRSPDNLEHNALVGIFLRRKLNLAACADALDHMLTVLSLVMQCSSTSAGVSGRAAVCSHCRLKLTRTGSDCSFDFDHKPDRSVSRTPTACSLPDWTC